MKRLLSALLALSMLFTLTACGDDPTGDVNSPAPDVGDTPPLTSTKRPFPPTRPLWTACWPRVIWS